MTAIGIDLGTTNSCVAVYRKGRVSVIEDAQGHAIMPSQVAEKEDLERLVGYPAWVQAEINPQHTYRAIKRLIGRAMDDPNVETIARTAGFAITPAADGQAWVQGRDRPISPAEISGLILRKLKEAAEKRLGETVSKAVVTVPAFFNEAQRRATKDACAIANLDCLRIINEPTAAAVAVLHELGEAKTVAVYDLGGGTFDLSILKFDGEDFEVLASVGDSFLGGEDLDWLLVHHAADAFLAETGIDARTSAQSKMQMQRLKMAVEDAKKALSTAESHELALGFFALKNGAEQELRLTLTRETLEALAADLIARTVAICNQALADAGLTAGDIEQVILVGGQTRMPAVQRAVAAIFGAAPIIHPNPDQIVAQGAAIMAASLTGQLDLELEDVTPFGIGIETADRGMFWLLEAQSKIPARVTRAVTTAQADQAAVTVRARQGNALMAEDNLPLGQFHVSGLRPGPAGSQIVDITLDIDADGIITVGGRDRATGRANNMMLESPSGLAPKAIERLRRAAKSAKAA